MSQIFQIKLECFNQFVFKKLAKLNKGAKMEIYINVWKRKKSETSKYW